MLWSVVCLYSGSLLGLLAENLNDAVLNLQVFAALLTKHNHLFFICLAGNAFFTVCVYQGSCNGA